MAKPAGVQIRRWFRLLLGLLIVVGLSAMGGGYLLLRSARAVAEQTRPLASATASVRHAIVAAQKDLFRYLAEFEPDTASVVVHLDAAAQQVSEARTLGLAGETENELREIEAGIGRYRKVIDLMAPSQDGSKDWSRLQELSEAAVAQGREVEGRAARLAESARAEIRMHDERFAHIARWVVWSAAGVLGLSLFLAVALRRWWRRFEDFILGL